MSVPGSAENLSLEAVVTWSAGALMALAGLGYLTLLAKPLANYLAPYNLLPAALGETSLMLWLLIVGVNVHRWNEQASGASE